MFNLKDEKMWIKLCLLFTAGIVFAVSLSMIFRYGNYFLLGDINTLDNNDDVKYLRSALLFLEKGTLVYGRVDQPTVFIMPGITYILAFFMKLLGFSHGIIGFRIFQAVLHFLGLFIFFFLIRDVFNNSKIALLACVIEGAYIPNISNTGLILTEEIFKFLLYLLLYFTLWAVKEKKAKYYMGGGVILGLACLFRPTIALFPVLVLLMWVLYRYRIQEMIKYTLITLTVITAVMAPWWIRNYLEFDRFIPLTESSGNPFLQGTYINYDQSKDYMSYRVENNEIKMNETEFATGIERLKLYFPDQKKDYLYWYTVGKTYRNWNYPYYDRPILNVSHKAVSQYHRIIVLLGLLGVISALVKNKTNFYPLMMFLIILYFNTIHLIYFAFPRYMYPIMGLVIAFAAFQLFEFYLFFRQFVPKFKNKIDYHHITRG